MTDLERAARAIHATKEYGAAPGFPYGSLPSEVHACEAYAAAVIETLAERGYWTFRTHFGSIFGSGGVK